MHRRARSLTAALATLATLHVSGGATTVAAQPVDPYADPEPVDPGPADPAPRDGAVAGDRDPEIDAAVAASLVARARELIAVEAWQDAQQLLAEALALGSAEARPLLDQVNARLGIGGAPAGDGGAVGGPGIGDTIDWGDGKDPVDQVVDDEIPPVPGETPHGGRRLMWHTTVMGGVVGGFIGDAASADLDDDGIDEEDGGGVVAGVLLGAAGGLLAGYGLRRLDWITRDDVVVVDSFAAMGLVGGLSLGALMDPPEAEAYSVNAALGTLAGAVTGLVIARRHDISSRRMLRVDLWASAGAVAPWLIFLAADGDSGGAQAAGFFSIAGMVGGAYLGFRTTRGWDDVDVGGDTDAPPAIVRRGADGAWSLGAPAVRAAHLPALGPAVGAGAAVDVVGVRF